MTSQQPTESTASPQDASAQSTSPEAAGSANPDHQGGKVESTPQPQADGTVAPTDDEKGGSSE